VTVLISLILSVSAGCAVAEPAGQDPFLQRSGTKPVQCEGTYPKHLQGICTNGEGAIYWSFTDVLVKSDAAGKVLKKVPVADHHGDLCHKGGKVYVAVNLGKFNHPEGKADSWVYVYDAESLAEIARHRTSEVVYGAGGIGCRDGRFFLVGGLPPAVEENFVYEYDSGFQFIRQHSIKSGYTRMGIQTAAFADGCWWFGCYGDPKILLKTDEAFRLLGKYRFDASLGIVGLPSGRLLVARGSCQAQKGCVGSVRVAAADAERGLVMEDDMAEGKTTGMPGKSHQGPLPAADGPLLSLAAELRQDVSHLAEQIGERNVHRRPKELATAADWIEAEFAKVGYKVGHRQYEVSGVTCSNLEAEIHGTTLPEEIVVIGAHYDTVSGTRGANDNGSGVAAMLALARRFAHRKTDRTLRFVAFVNEEPPYFQTERMGSRVYAKECRRRGEKVTAMLSLETIGYYSDSEGSQKYPPLFSLLYPSTGNFIGFVGNLRSADLVRQVVATFRQHEPFPSEGGAFPEAIPGVGFSDQWSFWQEGYPALMVTDTAMFRYPHYHEPEDTVDKIDFERMARVVRGLGSVVDGLVNAGTDRE
jgi:hypothetical protein